MPPQQTVIHKSHQKKKRPSILAPRVTEIKIRGARNWEGMGCFSVACQTYWGWSGQVGEASVVSSENATRIPALTDTFSMEGVEPLVALGKLCLA